MKKLLIFVYCIFFFTMGNAFAVEIAWMHVQNREYGSGKSFNRLGFGLIDDRKQYLTDNKKIKEVNLYNTEKKELKLSAVKFDSVEEIFGSYDFKNSQWYYSKAWQFDSWFSADILDSLTPGMYWLKVTTVDGKLAEQTYAFNGRVELPIINSNSFQLNPDTYGNLIWTWNIPIELGRLSLNYKMRARASIEIFKDKKYVGYFSIILPAHLGYVFIPRDVAQIMNQNGDRFELKISLETRDKNNRTYSKPYIISEKLPPVSGR
ncbi:MAG: hypothetical protein JSU83_00470 [Deltaproteobacteria bacterium]|nr:MAG: hypothetical protein JSU83_00470 [Deltaproteobacteria bacterium]